MNEIANFSSIFSEHNAAAMVNSFTGFSFTHVLTYKESQNVVSTLNIKPRTYEKEYASQVGEQSQPGNFQVVMLGNVQGLSYRVISQGLWIPSFFLSVPFTNSNIDFNATVDNTFGVNLKVDYENRFKNCVVDLSLDKSNSISLDVEAASEVILSRKLNNDKKCRYGLGLSYDFNESKVDCRAVADIDLKKVKLGSLLTTDFKSSLITLLTAQKQVGETKVASQLTMIPAKLVSNLSVGFEREFSTSNLSTSFSTTGILSSVYTKVINRNVRLTLSSTINLPEQDYGFGLSVSLS